MGGYQFSCDLVTGHPVFFMRLNLEGELLSEHNHELDLGPFNRSELIALQSGQMVFASDVVSLDGGGYSNSLFGFDTNGEQLLWESDWEGQSIDNIINIDENVVVFCDSQLYMVDDAGNPVDSLSYGSPPVDVSVFQGKNVLLLWEDSVYTLDITPQLESLIAVDDEIENATRILVRNEYIYIWFNSILKEYTSDFELVESTDFEILPYFINADMQINDSEICLVGDKSFDVIPVSNGGFYRSGAFALYSLSESSQEFDADVAIRHLELTTFTASQTNEDPPLFNLYAEVSGYVVNTGNEEVQSVNINFLGDQGIACGIEAERLQLSEINLSPGDSVPFVMDGLNYISVYISDSTGAVNFCVFASAPSGLYDRDETNDTGCVTGDFGVGIKESFRGISSIYPNPARDQVTIYFSEANSSNTLQVFDATGRQIDEFSIIRQNQLELNIADWNMGLYYFRTISDGKVSEPVRVSIVH